MSRIPARLLVAALLFGGCAGVDRRAGFGDVRDTVSGRLDKRVVWYHDSKADQEVERTIDVLLQDELTVDEAIQVALLYNRDLQAAYEEVGVAQADLVEAGLLRNPVFEAQFRLPGRPFNPYELHVVQEFIDILFIPLRRNAAAAALETAKFRVADIVLDHAAETRRSFYLLQGAEQLVEMRKTVAEATEASAMLAGRQYEAGNISDLALANEQALHEQAIVDLALAEGEALEQREKLNELLGLWRRQSAQWRIRPRLPEAAIAERSEEELESLAVSQRLDLLAKGQEIESLGKSLGLAKRSALIPTLEMGAHVEREPDGVATWGPSVGFTLPVFNQGQPAIARGISRLRQKQQEYLALAVRVQAEVRLARNRMREARRVAEHYKTVMLPLRGKIVEESQLHYNAMQIGPIRLLQAKQAELEAGSRYIEALRNHWVASADLERAVGERLEFAIEEEAVVEPPQRPTKADPHSHGGNP